MSPHRISARWGVLIVAGLAAGPAMAKPGTPGPAYFSGSYERIGRLGGGIAALQNDRVTIVPEGQGVVIAGCTGAALTMGFGPAFEITDLMTGTQAGVTAECLFHNNGYNRPILPCRRWRGVYAVAFACGCAELWWLIRPAAAQARSADTDTTRPAAGLAAVGRQRGCQVQAGRGGETVGHDRDFLRLCAQDADKNLRRT